MRDWGLYACYRMRNWSQPLAGRFAAPAAQGELPEGQEKPHWGAPPCNPSAHCFTAGSIPHFLFSITASHTKKAPLSRCFQLVEKVRFLFCASCDSTHKIEFAQQIHKNRGRVPRFLYKGRKNVSGGRGFSSAFDRKRGFDREAARKTIVFRQPQSTAFAVLFAFL